MKILRKSSLLFLLVLCFTCAETDISNNTRILVEGKVIDSENNPIPNALITIRTDANTLGASQVILGDGASDDSGNFSIVSLFGSNEVFEVFVELMDSFSTYTYRTNTSNFTPDDLIIDIGTVQLKALSRFNYTIDRTSGLGNSIQYSFRFTLPFCEEVFEEGNIQENQTFCFEEQFLSRTLNDNRPNDERTLVVPLNSSVEFIYRINDGDEESELLTINNTSFNFEFNY